MSIFPSIRLYILDIYTDFMLCASQRSATVPFQWPHQGPGTVSLHQSGPRRPYRRFVVNWRHSSSALVTTDIIINLFHRCTFLWPSDTHFADYVKYAPAAFSHSVTLIFSFLIIIINITIIYSLLCLLFLILDCFYFASCQSSFKRIYDIIMFMWIIRFIWLLYSYFHVYVSYA